MLKKLIEQQPLSLKFDPKKYWNRRASKDDLISVMQKPELDRAEQQMMSVILDDLEGGESVLDFGCGIGRFFLLLKERFKTVWATDFSEEMVRKAKESNGNGIRFCKVNDLKPVDMVFSFTVLLHIVSDRLWKETLQKLLNASQNYLLICEQFKTKRRVLGRHNKLRTLRAYLDEIGQFEWYKFYPNQANGLDVLIIKK